MKRLLVLGTVGALMLSFWAAGPAQAAGNATCRIAGAAKFTPGLKTAKQSVSYTFNGNATNCNSSNKAVKSGKITASGKGSSVSCSGGATNGTGRIAWNTGTSSLFSFTTSGTGPEVKVSGRITSGEFAGSAITAVLAFAANPAQCAGAGVSSAPFNGVSRVA
jgi:hypothetical protein